MKTLLTSVLILTTLISASAMAQPPHSQGLPPGWQKKLDYRRGDYLDRELLRYGRVYDIDDRRQRVEIEDRVYTIIKDTREIIDILNGRH